MNDVVREKLCFYIDRYGVDSAANAKLCENYLRDVCGSNRREISILVAAVRDRVPAELLNINKSLPLEVTLSKLAKRLNVHLGLTNDAARWCVESWAIALKVATPKQLMSPFECPACGIKGQVSRLFFGSTARCGRCKTLLQFTEDGVAQLQRRPDSASVPNHALHQPSLANVVTNNNQRKRAVAPAVNGNERLVLSGLEPEDDPPSQEVLRAIVLEPTLNRPKAQLPTQQRDKSTRARSEQNTAPTLPLRPHHPAVINPSRGQGSGIRKHARAKVLPPALFLVVIGVATTLFHVCVLYCSFKESYISLKIIAFIDNALVRILGIGNSESDMHLFRVLVSVVGLQLGVTQVIAGFRLTALRGYWLAIFAFLIGSVPYLSPLCFFSIPIFVWTLAVLYEGSVRKAFG